MADPIAQPPLSTSSILRRVADPALSKWHRRMKLQVDDTQILVLGDSTGTTTTPERWVQLLARKLAADWPAHTVILRPWDDTTKTYPAGSAITIQTGTGARTLTIWNCSVSGAVSNYILTNQVAIKTGVTPDVLIFSYGHNSPQDALNYRAVTHQYNQFMASFFTEAARLLVVQNPRAQITTGATLAADYAPDQIRQRVNYDYGVSEGYLVVDVNAAFLAYGDYNAGLLVDGLHPNPAGSELWANLVFDAMRYRPAAIFQSGQVGRLNRLWVPATSFLTFSGSPSLSLDKGMPAWLLDAASDEAVVATVDWPTDWRVTTLLAYYSAPATPSAGEAIVLETAHQYLSDPTGWTGSTTIGTWTVDTTNTLGLSSSANKMNVNALVDRSQMSARPVGIRVTRKATNAADTLAQDAAFCGMMIQRVY